MIQRGDTLLSIVEREMNGKLPVSIDQLIADFQTLNPHVNAHSLQIGKRTAFRTISRNSKNVVNKQETLLQ